MLDLSYLILIFILSIIFHELGHWFYFSRALKKDVLISFGKYAGKLRLFTGKESDYSGLNKTQLKDLYSSGVYWGAAPLVISLILNPSQAPYLLPVAVFYALGCSSDLNKIKSLK